MFSTLSKSQWQQYLHEGYLKLGKLLDDAALRALQARIDAIMLGQADLDYSKLLMQLDPAEREPGAPAHVFGHPKATLNYRKIDKLEHDSLFLQYAQRPVFRDLCQRVYGEDTPIASYRAMFMNKAAGHGSRLNWHQDRWTFLDRDPLLTVWTALDPATRENGCVQIIPGSHHKLHNPSHESGFLTPDQTAELCPPDDIVYLELEAGEVALLHNWTLHSSDGNTSDTSRRAFSVCYMHGATCDLRTNDTYPILFGEGALTTHDTTRN